MSLKSICKSENHCGVGTNGSVLADSGSDDDVSLTERLSGGPLDLATRESHVVIGADVALTCPVGLH